MIKTFTINKDFPLECGKTIQPLTLAYSTYGTINTKKNNIIWIFQPFSMDSQCAIWWDALVGPDKTIDTRKYFVICVNVPGSCYGSTGPLSINPTTGEPYYHDFPLFTPRDMINAFQQLATHLEVDMVLLGLGPSIGGMQLLEWSIEQSSFFKAIAPMMVGAKASAWAKAYSVTQRMCIATDCSWKQKHKDAGIQGMRVARAMALMSYRDYDIYEATQQDDDNHELLENYKVESYQTYQGEKIGKRFNAFSYFSLCKSFEAYNLARGRSSMRDALQAIKAKTLVIGIKQDRLFPIEEQIYLAEHIPDASVYTISSRYGHDGFLLEYQEIQKALATLLREIEPT